MFKRKKKKVHDNIIELNQKNTVPVESLGIIQIKNFDGVGVGMIHDGKVYIFPLNRTEISMFVDQLIGEIASIGV